MAEGIINVGGKLVNSYLVKLKNDEYLLIDTGYKWEYGDFLNRLKEKNVDLKSIKYVALTHAHADHAGFLKALLSDTEATLIYDTADKTRLEAGKNNLNTYISTFTALIVSKCTIIFTDKTQIFPAVKYDKVIDADVQPLADYGIEFIKLKGHSEHDLCVKYKDVLFCGDICISSFGSTRFAPYWIYNKYDLVDSWRKIFNDKEIVYLLPGHGKPILRKKLLKSIEYWRNKGVFPLYKKKNTARWV